MDGFDVRLLSALQHEGRLTNNELADKVGLSASQCSRRRAALEEAGVIAGYAAHLVPDACGLGVTAYVQVTLAAHSPENAERFAALLRSVDEVQEACSLTGEADYLIRLVTVDLRSLSKILNEVFLPHASVANVRSSIVLDQIKQTTRLPLGHLHGISP